MKNLFPIAQHYEEHLPSENAGVKESEARLQATQERWNKMKFEAMLKGYIITGQSQAHHEDAQKHFQESELPKHPDAPKIKIKDLILNSAIMRMLSVKKNNA